MPTKRRALIDLNGADRKLIDVGAFVVLRIRDRGLQNLLHDRRGLALAEIQYLDGAFHGQAPHLVGDESRLLWGQTRIPQFRP